MEHYVSSIDGIPGIMPGIKSLLPPPPFGSMEKLMIFEGIRYAKKCNGLPKLKVRAVIKQPKKSK